MKKTIFIASLGMLFAAALSAQTIYDAANLASKDLNGTARFVGMGGAMGALGGDISTMRTNPAGIGIYRSNDVMTSFGLSSYGTESKYGARAFNSDNIRGSFDNIGFVITSKIGNQTSLRYVNFGFNYHKSKSFYKNMKMEGNLGKMTQTDYMAFGAGGLIEWGNDQLRDDDLGWLSVLGYNSWLITDITTDPGTATFPNDPYYDDNHNQINTWDGKPLYVTPGYYLGMYIGEDKNTSAQFRSKERGGVDQYDFNVALNFNDRVYLGLTVGAYSVNYSKYSSYSEDNGSNEKYKLQSWNKIKGTGADAKLGIIVRPFENSPFRIGAAVHTPTFYELDYKTNALIESDVLNLETGKIDLWEVDTYKDLNGDMTRPFRLQTPWVFNFSLGHTVGSVLALGAEYEYKDYSATKFRDTDGNSMGFEDRTTSMLKGVHTLRLGAECKVIPQFAIRAGYNYNTSIYKTLACKDLPLNSIQTDTDFANSKNMNDYTFGIGYRGSIFYADLAYKFSTYKADFYPFVNMDGAWEDGKIILPEATSVTNTRSQVLLTLGVRF